MDNMDSHEFLGMTPISMFYSPSIVGKRQMRGRPSHALILKMEGTTAYSTENRQWLLSPGQILFVEKGSCYSIREITTGYSFMINFDCPGVFRSPVFQLPLPPNYDLASLAERLHNAWQKDDRYYALAILYGFFRKVTASKENIYASPKEKQQLASVMAYLKEHLTDPHLSLDILPRLAGVSDVYLRRIFKKQYGIAPAGYVTRERIRLAKDFLLRIEGIRIAEVAEKVGYTDPLYFSRLFKKHTGFSPSEYAKSFVNTLF